MCFQYEVVIRVQVWVTGQVSPFGTVGVRHGLRSNDLHDVDKIGDGVEDWVVLGLDVAACFVDPLVAGAPPPVEQPQSRMPTASQRGRRPRIFTPP